LPSLREHKLVGEDEDTKFLLRNQRSPYQSDQPHHGSLLTRALQWLGQSGDIAMTSNTKPTNITPTKKTTPEQQKAAAIKPTDQERFNKARKALREYWVNR